jgi:hypothetical protein
MWLRFDRKLSTRIALDEQKAQKTSLPASGIIGHSMLSFLLGNKTQLLGAVQNSPTLHSYEGCGQLRRPTVSVLDICTVPGVLYEYVLHALPIQPHRAFADFQRNLGFGSRLTFAGKLSNPCAKLLNQ